jgi:hypothetical protein
MNLSECEENKNCHRVGPWQVRETKRPRAGAPRGRIEEILAINWRTPRKQILTAGTSSTNLQGLYKRFEHEVRLLSLGVND